MRKYQQKQILELIHTLNEAIDVMKQLLSKADYPFITQLLADSQECAVKIGNYIEDIMGEGTEIVSLLEEFCEVLYQISLGIRETAEVEKGVFKCLRKQLIEIKKSVNNELKPDKIEITFFPYKASMWDSMESIWKAAKDDERCEVFVVPIPYYDKLSDGTFGKMYYEGNDYPDYVQITDWSKYDVEAQHPDVIFIHNPYDNNNLVTSVHPYYYSKSLKNKTDLLVYIDYGIPFWVHKTPVSGSILPAFAVYDIIVAYSKEFADAIRFALRDRVSEGVFPKQVIEQNSCVALGSPKFDAVINTRRKHCALPDKWQKLIAGKKVILLSTSVGAMLQGNEHFIVKLRSILKVFQSRKDITLWWRPHPLSEGVYASMRPHLLKEYKEIVEDYIAKGWGVYDDTVYLHRAIAWSDACYTDESSLMFLYLATGKPFSVRTFSYDPPNHITDNVSDFTPILDCRIKSMQTAKGANVFDNNNTIWWHNFVDADFVNNVQYDNYLDRFIHFILNESDYPNAELYRQLKLQMFKEFVENPDGTAGQKIYDFIKKKILG